MKSSYLTFRLSSEIYAVALDCVSEIAAYPERIARVPTAPDWVRGVFSLRGDVVPAVDLCRKLGYESSAATDRTCVLVTHLQIEGLALLLGIIVDSVDDLVELEPHEIEAPPAFGSSLRVECLLGIVRRGDGILCLLDLFRMFKSEELLAATLADERNRAATAQVEQERQRVEALALPPVTAAIQTPSASLGRADPDIPGLFLFEDG